MSEKKFKLSFMNDGKEFLIPRMTVQRQEELMEEMAKHEGKLSEEKFNREMNKRLILKTLQIVDKNVSLENINNLHPDDYVVLFTAIWDAGREFNKSDATDFRKEK